MSYESFDKCIACIEKMQHTALYYAPTMQELTTIIVPDLDKYILFLMWIDETGEETDENRESRRYISRLLRENLILHENHTGRKKKEVPEC